ncbi:Pyrroline-5-carboxylate reductase [Porphyridium purpureum]|uniref:Pyrroline-5-carboxylate reductase n=1 Tax=Porphyridium purpureum TaxID=35688 RepID=A0A5J4ZA49_PORPP|nr:Pyrroline-5-carboxylate reductase [Porphyridium purpureum]|eukprot:POR9491..scf295_1
MCQCDIMAFVDIGPLRCSSKRKVGACSVDVCPVGQSRRPQRGRNVNRESSFSVSGWPCATRPHKELLRVQAGGGTGPNDPELEAQLSLGCIGGGNMAWAILSGLVSNKVIPAQSIFVCDRNEKKLQQYKDLGIQVVGSVRELSKCSAVLLAVKPYAAANALSELSPDCRALVISVCAGLRLETLQGMLSPQCPARLARVMPNTPCLVGQGASAYALGPSATAQDSEVVQLLFRAISVIVKVEESMLDAVTGLSGSGPAFVLMFIEALADGGVQNGLRRDTAQVLAAQLVYGTAKMVMDNPDTHVAELRNRVESPGGTTVAGTAALEKDAFRAAVQSAVRAATLRSKELA